MRSETLQGPDRWLVKVDKSRKHLGAARLCQCSFARFRRQNDCTVWLCKEELPVAKKAAKKKAAPKKAAKKKAKK